MTSSRSRSLHARNSVAVPEGPNARCGARPSAFSLRIASVVTLDIAHCHGWPPCVFGSNPRRSVSRSSWRSARVPIPRPESSAARSRTGAALPSRPHIRLDNALCFPRERRRPGVLRRWRRNLCERRARAQASTSRAIGVRSTRPSILDSCAAPTPCTSAPASSRARTTSTPPAPPAKCSGDALSPTSRAFGSAPCASKRRTASTCSTARCKPVLPSAVRSRTRPGSGASRSRSVATLPRQAERTTHHRTRRGRLRFSMRASRVIRIRGRRRAARRGLARRLVDAVGSIAPLRLLQFRATRAPSAGSCGIVTPPSVNARRPAALGWRQGLCCPQFSGGVTFPDRGPPDRHGGMTLERTSSILNCVGPMTPPSPATGPDPRPHRAASAAHHLERELCRVGWEASPRARHPARSPVRLRCCREFAEQSALLDRFLLETRTAARFSHPNIVPVVRVGIARHPAYAWGSSRARQTQRGSAPSVPTPRSSVASGCRLRTAYPHAAAWASRHHARQVKLRATGAPAWISALAVDPKTSCGARYAGGQVVGNSGIRPRAGIVDHVTVQRSYSLGLIPTLRQRADGVTGERHRNTGQQLPRRIPPSPSRGPVSRPLWRIDADGVRRPSDRFATAEG